MVNEFEIIKSIDYSDIPNFPLATVESHSGKLIYGKLHGKKILAMQGRFHYYEGYSLAAGHLSHPGYESFWVSGIFFFPMQQVP